MGGKKPLGRTPGPWVPVDSGDDNWSVTDRNGHVIAAVMGSGEGDALAIAAIDELVSALKYFIATDDRQAASGSCGCRACRQAIRAITQAEGHQ